MLRLTETKTAAPAQSPSNNGWPITSINIVLLQSTLRGRSATHSVTLPHDQTSLQQIQVLNLSIPTFYRYFSWFLSGYASSSKKPYLRLTESLYLIETREHKVFYGYIVVLLSWSARRWAWYPLYQPCYWSQSLMSERQEILTGPAERNKLKLEFISHLHHKNGADAGIVRR